MLPAALPIFSRFFAPACCAAMISVFGAAADAPAVEIRTADAELFFKVFDAAGGKPTADALQHGYLDAGSDGVRQMIPGRIGSAENLARVIAEKPGTYEKARQCLADVVAVKGRVESALGKLRALLPEGSFPPVTVLIGADNAGGTPSKAGVLIGLETACKSLPGETSLQDHFVRLIVHEYAHVEQAWFDKSTDTNPPTVLELALVEGVAEFVADRLTGSPVNVHLQHWTAGHEPDIDAAFLKDKDSTDLSHWFFNGLGTPEHPGDLGYWVGYRIAKRYEAQASDPQKALRELVMTSGFDAKRLFVQSGWAPAKS